jgi:hypothetical protein
LFGYAMVFTNYDKMARCIFTSIVRFQAFDFICCLSFNKGFVRLKHWYHIKFPFKEINYSEPKIVIYECCKVDISIQRFCLHGTNTNVWMYEFKYNFGLRITPLNKWNFVLFANNTSFRKWEVVELSVGNYVEFRWSYVFLHFMHVVQMCKWPKW